MAREHSSNPTLAALQTKVQWAEKHFSDFKDIAFGRSTGIDSRETTVVHYKRDRQPGPGPLELAAPSQECRLAFGDAVHQLRSCLDHVAYALVKPRTNDVKVLRRVDFPIYTDEQRFKGSMVVRHLKQWLTSAEFNAVENAQPFRRKATTPTTDWLWILSELDNIDKHRTVLVVDPLVLVTAMTVDGEIRQVKRPLLPSPLGFSVPRPTIPAADEVSVEDQLVLVVAETGLACDNTTAVHIWRSMIGEVKRTIATFEPFF
jgi:hypothetical protein